MDCEQHLLPALLEALNDDPRNYGVRGKLVAAIGELGFRNHAMTAALSVSGHLIKQGHILPALFVLCESKSYNGFSSPRIQERLQFLHGESVLSEVWSRSKFLEELPPQLLSRFPVRIRLDYPPEDVECRIIKKHVKNLTESDVLLGIKLANTLRQASAVEELYYSPSIRETIAFAKLLESGVSAKESAKIVFGNVYSQWGNVEFQKVNDIITSMFGS